jgi:transcriptional regulator with XRE-family HTH domain
MSQTTDTVAIPEWTLRWRLHRSLAHAGVSIDEMATELGVTRQTVSRWLNEHGEPRSGFLKLWALRTGVPYEWLRTRAEVRKQDNRHPRQALRSAA